MSSETLRTGVFLDRDDTLIVDKHYLKDPNEIELLPGVKEGLSTLKNAGFCLMIVSNQSGIGRGLLSAQDFFDCQERLMELLGDPKLISGHYFSPYHPTEAQGEYLKESSCRKPGPDMLLQAAQHHSIDLKTSFMVGDKHSDVDAGLAAGCRPILVGSAPAHPEALAHVHSFSEVVETILNADS